MCGERTEGLGGLMSNLLKHSTFNMSISHSGHIVIKELIEETLNLLLYVPFNSGTTYLIYQSTWNSILVNCCYITALSHIFAVVYFVDYGDQKGQDPEN